MTADLKQAAQIALLALEYHTQQTRPITQTEEAIKVLMEALAAASSQAPAEGDGDERAAFEAYCTAKHDFPKKWSDKAKDWVYERAPDGGYYQFTMHACWLAWQAGQARAARFNAHQVDGDDEIDSQLEEAWSENEALKEELQEFRAGHPYGRCTIVGPAEDVAFIFKHLPDIDEAQSDVQPKGTADFEVMDGSLYCWLVEEFEHYGNSTGRFLLDQGDLTVTSDVHAARKFKRSRSAHFRAEEMRAKHGKDWKAVQHAFVIQSPAPAHDLKAQALALCHALEEQPGSQYQTAAVLAAFKVYRAFESIEQHGEIRQWVFDVAAPCAAVGADDAKDAARFRWLIDERNWNENEDTPSVCTSEDVHWGDKARSLIDRHMEAKG